ncbi:MAG: glycerate kinase family protein [Culicoidibacterales bacterium]
MKIIVAPDSYKESLDAVDVANAMEAGIYKVYPQAKVVKVPIADGGEGTIKVIEMHCGGIVKTKMVCGADANMVEARYLMLEDTAIIEIATASGLEQIDKEQRNPFTATSFGAGSLMLDALETGCKKFIIGLGGSACNDGGSGLLQALGVKLLDKQKQSVMLGNNGLADVASVNFTDFYNKYGDIEIIIASDVTNPLLGKKGASFTFGKQKGAKNDLELRLLDENIAVFSKKIVAKIGVDHTKTAGAGAAGGIGFALMCLSKNVETKSGIEVVLDIINFDAYLDDAALVLTGEGATDFQTAYGKAPIGVARRAKIKKVPTVIISGKVEGDLTLLYDEGVKAAFSVLHTITTLKTAMKDAAENITYTTEAVIRLFA